MKDAELLENNSQQSNRKKWESPKLEAWNTEEFLALNPLKFLINTDQTLGS
ncbi:hypothetical protein PQG22_11525 [Aquirufa beregesia]